MIHNLEDNQRSEPISGRQGVTARDIMYGVLGLLAGLLVLSGVWIMANRADSATNMPQITKLNRPAADFELETLDGTTVKLSDYRGKIVLLNFWRTDCVPCQAETPALQKAYTDLKDDGVEIIGINLLRDERLYQRDIDAVRQFTTLYGVSYPIALDADGQVSQEYLVGNIPVSYMIDPDGNARFVRIGELTTANVKAMVNALKQGAALSATSE